MLQGSSLQKIEQVIAKLRPAIQMDGGDIELVKFEQDIVYVRLLGACVGCPVSQIHLKMGIEEAIKEQVPQVTEVVQVD